MSKFYRVIYFLFAKILKFCMRIHIHGAENEPMDKNSSFLVCSNHISATDPITVCIALKRHQPHFMAKKELFKIPLLNLLIKALGAYPVNRGGADVSAIKTSIKMLKDGTCLGIFPQGHRFKGVDPLTTEVKNGAAMIAVRAECPILPIYIKMKNNKPGIFRRRDVYIGKPIDPAEMAYDAESNGEYPRISKYVFEKICALPEEKSADQ